jgi:hypothetical protein
MGKLTAGTRQALPKSDFALPGQGEGPKGAGAGSYPIPDKSHAVNALARVSQHGTPAEQTAVRGKVKAKFPEIKMVGEPSKTDHRFNSLEVRRVGSHIKKESI